MVGDQDVDIGANPSAEGGGDEEVDPTQRRVVDIVDAARLQVDQNLSFPKTWLPLIVDCSFHQDAVE